MPIELARGRSGCTPAAAVAAERERERWLRHEQAILHHLGRIGEWERPELTASLRRALMAVPVAELAKVFELCWRMHRTRNKALDNPAGWWARMLSRAAEGLGKTLNSEEKHV